MSWEAQPEEMLLGDLTGADPLKTKFLDDARDEMLIHIGEFYEIPLPSEIPKQVELILKQIHTRLSTGRFILAQATGGEDDDLHAYGLYLIEEARNALQEIGNRTPIATATKVASSTDSSIDLRPSITSPDASSPFDAMNKYAFLGGIWEPEY